MTIIEEIIEVAEAYATKEKNRLTLLKEQIMTTAITVAAHCNEKTEVAVIETDNVDPSVNKRVILQDKETQTFYVYDNKVFTIQEVQKV